MFDEWLGSKKEIKAQVESENKQMALAREQTAIKVASDAYGDQVFKQQQDAKSDLLKWQQSLDDELFLLVMTLKGYAKTESGGWEKIGQALCKDAFIDKVVIPHCRPLLSRNLINSNLGEETIYNMLRDTSNIISDEMADSYKDTKKTFEYGISFLNFDTVVRLIKNTIIPAPFRAISGWNKKVDSTNMKRVEAFAESGREPQKSSLERWFKS